MDDNLEVSEKEKFEQIYREHINSLKQKNKTLGKCDLCSWNLQDWESDPWLKEKEIEPPVESAIAVCNKCNKKACEFDLKLKINPDSSSLIDLRCIECEDM